MPELPDLQVFSSNLTKELAGKKLKKINIVAGARINTPKSKFKRSIEGATLKKVEREGKELRFHFSNGHVVGVHLMLHGNMNLFEKKNQEKHALFEFVFDDDTGLAISDFQKKANVTLNPIEKDVPDALSTSFNANYFVEVAEKKRTNIKALMMDQSIVRGIGNAYADEILWKAKISPFSMANKIPAAKIRRLVTTVQSVLKDAEKQIRKKNPEIISGEVRDFLKIHNAKKEKSPTGAPILFDKKGGRKTYYTEEQQLFE